MGTIKWSWLDDEGKQWTHLIPNSYYSQAGGVRLLSPQHFAQQTGDLIGAGSRTNGKSVRLYWNNNTAQLTVPLSPRDNVATMFLAPGYQQFQESVYATRVTTDNAPPEKEILHTLDLSSTHKADVVPWTHRQTTPFDTTKSSISQYSTRMENQTKLQDEYLTLHESMGHIHHDRLQLMARQGTIPKKFLNCRLPFCASCAYGKQIRTSWRSRTSNNKDESTTPATPGECISVDQLISPSPGIIAQMSGKLTTERYTCATIFVDQHSSLSFVWIQKSTSADETLKGKRAFETFARHHGVVIRHYHADNGIFRAKAWVEDCASQRESMSYSAVGAHHQNGVAERRIRPLQEMTRTILIHAQHRWKQAISPYLWPYALRVANDEWNMAPNPRDPASMSQCNGSLRQLCSGTCIMPFRLAVQHMCWKTNCNRDYHFINGSRDQT